MALGQAVPPPRPARPERPLLRPPKEMAKRRAFGSQAGRIALIHALAHIELNAIDLVWDLVARFTGEKLPRAVFDDWVEVAAEEAYHFVLLAGRLAELGARYGDLPAHDGLWEAAAATVDDLLARLAVVPLVLEARGLDVTPQMAARLERAGDAESAQILRRIYRDEIEPAHSRGDMADLVAIDMAQDLGTLDIADPLEPSRHLRSHVEPACFEHQRHNGEAREQVICGRGGGFPQSVMSRQVAIARVEICEPTGQQFEMAGFLGGDADPVVEEVARQSLAGGPGNQVPSQVDGVELDMGEGVDQRHAARP